MQTKKVLSDEKLIEEGKKVFDTEITALEAVRDSLDKTFADILRCVINCEGKVIITGMGKPGHIATKIAATLSSLGTSSFYLHPAEAMHGDLGMVSENDVVIAISYSGESDEIIRILPTIKLIGATLIAITGNGESTLAQHSDLVQIFPYFEEACYLGLAPTSSTTAALCYGDALAVVSSGVYGFTDENFGKYHPAGSLGKKLLIKVEDLMASGEKNATVSRDATFKDAIIELGRKGLGCVLVLNDDGTLAGIVTDGDMRRCLERGVDIYGMNVVDIMCKTPVSIDRDSLAIKALNEMRSRNISCLPVMDDNKPIGIIRIMDIVNVGIVG